jgi:hypothetical protein
MSASADFIMMAGSTLRANDAMRTITREYLQRIPVKGLEPGGIG